MTPFLPRTQGEAPVTQIDEKVLAVLDQPRINSEIESLTGLLRYDVSKALKRLHAQGKIISLGATTSRKHMRLAAAIERLFHMVYDLQSELNALPIQRSRR